MLKKDVGKSDGLRTKEDSPNPSHAFEGDHRGDVARILFYMVTPSRIFFESVFMEFDSRQKGAPDIT